MSDSKFSFLTPLIKRVSREKAGYFMEKDRLLNGNTAKYNIIYKFRNSIFPFNILFQAIIIIITLLFCIILFYFLTKVIIV